MKEWDTQYIAGLVLRARANDSDAFAELYAMTYNKVYNYCRHYLRDDFLAQDALQEVYILALKNLQKLNDPLVFIAWLNTICFNVCYDINQKQKNRSNQSADPELLEFIQDDRPGTDPESIYQKQAESERLKQALDSLPLNERQVLVMRFYNDMKLEEIAAAMGISRSSVKRYIASGQNALRLKLKE